ncbi:hypothetical protein [Nocardia sp. CA-119907]|uniref:hypothetical protein n=1 Tax=Nocardia sp. CA-119907 TaxID=3239973 RepID=UPI003D990538
MTTQRLPIASGSLRPHPTSAIEAAMAGHSGPSGLTDDGLTQLLKLTDQFAAELGVAAVGVAQQRGGTVLDGSDVKQAFDDRTKASARAGRQRELYYALFGVFAGGGVGTITASVASGGASVATIIVGGISGLTGLSFGVAGWRTK